MKLLIMPKIHRKRLRYLRANLTPIKVVEVDNNHNMLPKVIYQFKNLSSKLREKLTPRRPRNSSQEEDRIR